MHSYTPKFGLSLQECARFRHATKQLLGAELQAAGDAEGLANRRQHV